MQKVSEARANLVVGLEFSLGSHGVGALLGTTRKEIRGLVEGQELCSL